MALWGEDPKDQLIASQRDEIAYLRAKVDELQKELLALTDAGAYRMVHKNEPEAPGPPPAPSPMQLRHAPAEKDQLKTVAEIAAQFPNLEPKKADS